MNKVTISVPATSANLGPGFDCFGIAYNLYNTLEFEKTPGKFSFEGFEPEFSNEDNLAIVSFKEAEKAAGKSGAGCLAKMIACDIPVCRGLGSSSSIIIAGIMAYNLLYDAGFDDDKVLEIATLVEGHPDNVAPALFGGLTCAVMDDGVIGVEKYKPAANIHFTLIIPDFQLSTEKARGVLPKEIAREDAIYNISHAALLLTALQSGDESKIAFALKDKIHQPYRKGLIDEYDIVSEKALELGACAVCISGAGPTMLAIGSSDISHKLEAALTKACKHSWRVLDLKADSTGATVK